MLITMKNDNVTAVVDTFGGELISYQDSNKTEYLWSGDETFWSGRSPHLFPVIGTLKDNQILIEGNYYSINKHGFARNREFLVYEVTDLSVTLVLKDDFLTREVYPATFSLFVRHTLLENGFITSYQIVNQGDKVMYFNIGGHVGVRCPIMPKEKFNDYEIVFDKELTTSAYFPPNDNPMGKEQMFAMLNETNTLPLSYDLFENGAIILDKIASHSLLLRHSRYHHGVSFDYEGFPVLALWTFGKKKAPFLCLEPWHGLPAMVDDTIFLEEKPYIISLQPQQKRQMKYTLKILN